MASMCAPTVNPVILFAGLKDTLGVRGHWEWEIGCQKPQLHGNGMRFL